MSPLKSDPAEIIGPGFKHNHSVWELKSSADIPTAGGAASKIPQNKSCSSTSKH